VALAASALQRLIYHQVSDECVRNSAGDKAVLAIIKVTALVF
jgi:hypothetical protein